MMELQGASTAPGFRFAIIVSRFNPEVTDGLLRGARTALAEAGVRDDDITLVRVPGAFEIPVTAERLANTGRFDAIVCLGCVIKGDTMHFEFISLAATMGILQAGLETNKPISFGVLTTVTEEQAVHRSRKNAENKGREAAAACFESAALLAKL